MSPPSLRTGRADLPHPALRSMVYLHEGWRIDTRANLRITARAPRRRPASPFTPDSRVANMRMVPTDGLTLPSMRRGRSSVLSQRHCHWFVFRSSGHPTSIFLEPFAPPELPGFHATMVPLTPVRRLFASTLRLASIARLPTRTMNTGLIRTGLSAS